VYNNSVKKTEIFLASNNEHKHREFTELFPGFSIVLPKDRGIAFNPDETGTGFAENCLIKARALYEIVRQPVIADDSGLCVDILGGRPGIYTSRYAGKDFPRGNPASSVKLRQEEQNRLLLEEVQEAVERGTASAAHPRACRFVCALAYCRGPEQFFLVQETMEGTLVRDFARGIGGFGYDPIVMVAGTGKTAAELTQEEKNTVSHRGKAARALALLLNG
jgi:XTP/dITP diphosphohydrolase